MTRVRLGDVGALALTLAVAAMTLIDDVDAGSGWSTYTTVSLALTVIAFAVLTVRRRHPVGVAVALLPIVAVTEVAGGAALVAVFCVAALTTWRTALWITVLHFLAPIPVTVITYDTALGVVGGNLFGAALVALALAWGTAVRQRRELLESLRERAERAETEAELEAERSRWQERERIAREMHDVLAHRISLISLHAGALELGSDNVEATAGTIRLAARDALDDLRDVLGVLRSDTSPGVRPQRGVDDIAELVRESEGAGTTVHVDVCDVEDLDPANSRAAYRIAQEGLTNARKHAPGEHVTLTVEHERDRLHLTVVNQVGCGDHPTGPGSRSGLVGITERVRLADGTLEHGIVARGGRHEFVLEVWLPWTR
ncbi:sensor histidine kinase [Rhodococcoides trifolii]|uniref:sensor histidine kinase n=1 Tax=Rhodococcoides trifolii TaxID=908250 RepID=UPI001E547391|nr:histidine kinase [Rhodococcus trifolii]